VVEALFCFKFGIVCCILSLQKYDEIVSSSKQLLIDLGGCLLGVHSDYDSFLNFLKLPAACHL